MSNAIFLDRDGTINVDTGYVHTIEEFEFIPGAIDALRTLSELPAPVIVVTNQSGVGRGYFKESDVEALHEHMNDLLDDYDAEIDAFYYCPHHPDADRVAYRQDCQCRKPRPGLLKTAAEDFDVTFSESVMIGDSERDVEAGNEMGCHTILLDPEGSADTLESTAADAVRPDLQTAVSTVVSES
jgi:D-glycero-D-manno-heptose 1,7-bisphosphate phosphatase